VGLTCHRLGEPTSRVAQHGANLGLREPAFLEHREHGIHRLGPDACAPSDGMGRRAERLEVAERSRAGELGGHRAEGLRWDTGLRGHGRRAVHQRAPLVRVHDLGEHVPEVWGVGCDTLGLALGHGGLGALRGEDLVGAGALRLGLGCRRFR
jgi:hypothetical protein